MTTGPAITGVFDQQMARIKRIVQEEVPGYSAIFDRAAWPMIRFRVQDAQGTIVTMPHSQFSIAELEEFSDQKLRSVIRRFCRISK
jgi:hypothetical protein